MTDDANDGDVPRDHFVCGQTGVGRTTRLINWWQRAVAEAEEESIWINPSGDFQMEE